MMNKGVIYSLLNDVYDFLGLNDDFAETKQRIVRIRLSLKTGLSMNKYLPDSRDPPAEVSKIVEVLKAPEFGLDKFPFKNYDSF